MTDSEPDLAHVQSIDEIKLHKAEFGENRNDTINSCYIAFDETALNRQKKFIDYLEKRTKEERYLKYRLIIKLKRAQDKTEDVDFKLLNIIEKMFVNHSDFAGKDFD